MVTHDLSVAEVRRNSHLLLSLTEKKLSLLQKGSNWPGVTVS